ncbi:hypothetical protein MAR_016963 [Mya arenaria]|uniref:Uncharacterized protein n=1 Tax=Mya arenaria TaxID=6604 RepID=A0ABY7EAY2_MYAAR|nr:hypothetical protein MAR_016963 [Mya arenaria]
MRGRKGKLGATGRKTPKINQMILGNIENTLSPPQTPEPKQIVNDADQITRKQKGRKVTRRDRARAYREIFRLKVDLDHERRLKEKYRKRAYRLKQTNETEFERRVKITMESKELRKHLTLHDAKTKQEKRQIRRAALKKSILKKYRLNKYAKHIFGISSNSKTKTKKRPSLLKIIVVNFLDRDDNSRVKAGKSLQSVGRAIRNKYDF